MIYFYIFSFLIFSGLILQVTKTCKTYKIYYKFIELHNEIHNFFSALKSEDINNISQSVQNLSFLLPFYERNNAKPFLIRFNEYRIDGLNYLLQNYIDFLNDDLLQFQRNLYFKTMNSVFISTSYNISYYDEKRNKNFKNIFNPFIYLGNSLNFILSVLFQNIDLKFPSFLEKSISILSGIATIIQFIFFIKELIK